MTPEVTLTQEELRKLKNDKKVAKGAYSDEVIINPPCGIAGHKWSQPHLGPGAELKRKCENCDFIQTTQLDVEELFDSS